MTNDIKDLDIKIKLNGRYLFYIIINIVVVDDSLGRFVLDVA
jgi:hypothetical protein